MPNNQAEIQHTGTVAGAHLTAETGWLVDGPRLPEAVHPARRRWVRRARGLAVVAMVVAALVVFHRPILLGFARCFRVDDPAPADAIVLLLGGPSHRPRKAAELYRAGLAPRILIGPANTDSDLGIDENTLTRRNLVRFGVPAEAIETLPGANVTSTRDEALRVREYVRMHPQIHRIVVVTTGFHTARARWVFEKVLRGTGVEVRSAVAPWPMLDESDWYKTDEGLVLYFSEAIKTVYYRLVY